MPGVDGVRTSRRVLVIDDSAEMAETLKDALELFSHVVEIARSGPEGIAKAHDFHPEVVLCDIGLPEMDGYEVARRMRADPELRSVRLVALTGYGLPEERERSRKAGFEHHIVKPPSLELLEEVVGR
jgi:two-component system CheB/CheR fusion protein